MTADPSPARVAADRGRTERREADELALALRRSNEAGTHPLTDGLPGAVGGATDRSVLVGGEADVSGDGARVVDGRSSGSGHDATISDTKTLAKSEISGYDKSMNTTSTDTAQGIENTIANLLTAAVERFGSVDAAAEALMVLMAMDRPA